MRYICLVHADPKRFEQLTREEQQDLDRRSMAYDRELTEKGHYLAAEAIQAGVAADSRDLARRAADCYAAIATPAAAP